ncbi:MAG: hypothetical protein FJ276_10185, partial [Planctomycetes bacterium]|nr:hypothetical protein [Planctomycetota bacterium]
MRSVPWRRAPRRGARFERFEDRIVLSAIPGTDGWYAQTPDLVNPLPDWQDTAPAVAPLAVDAAAHSDAAYVRDTYGFEGIGQTVAIIDSGIAYWHEAFGGGFGTGHVVVGGWDFSERDADPHDDGPAGFHGTHVAGIIGSRCGVHTGVAPGVDLVALRVFNDMGLGYSSWVEEALRWVHNHRNDFRYPITTVNMSLGAKWNGAAPPSWGILEDELATLRADGIFVAVAAGNSFAQYGLPGLAYPAASPHVVPVASVDAAGALSGFSQRLGRVLAAPGEKITSTVPDHVFGADGVHNDWAAVSGTSMAAPYVAGASVLVREAMQLAGYTAIDQGVIYAHLRDTADLVFDPATGTTYHRVNLSAAIDALMPADDYGSCPADAFDLGMLTDTWTVSGRIDRLDDRDFFQFTAAANGVV